MEDRSGLWLLIKIGDGYVIGTGLDAVFRARSMRERPLIWKAELLRKGGNLK